MEIVRVHCPVCGNSYDALTDDASRGKTAICSRRCSRKAEANERRGRQARRLAKMSFAAMGMPHE